MILFQSFLNEPVSGGFLLSLLIIFSLLAYLYISTRRNIDIEVLKSAVNELHELGKDHEQRIRNSEATLALAVEIQKDMKAHLSAIDERHKKMDEEFRENRRKVPR